MLSWSSCVLKLDARRNLSWLKNETIAHLSQNTLITDGHMQIKAKFCGSHPDLNYLDEAESFLEGSLSRYEILLHIRKPKVHYRYWTYHGPLESVTHPHNLFL
jgi:hypothetical protein